MADPAALHVPVLPREVLAHLAPRPGGRYLDCTLGMGGHAAGILAAGGRVLGVDRDPRARVLAAQRLATYGELLEVRGGTFADAAEELVAAGERFEGVLADIGVSSLQIDDPVRGFGISAEARADMRMGEGSDEDALALIDRLDEDALADVIFRYGEERLSRRIARALKRARAGGETTAAGLARAVRGAVGGHQPRHPALRTFQALRIAVNDELGQLGRLLAALPRLLVPGGRAVVISFHSLEDRLVKQAFRAGRDAGIYSDAARKVVTAAEDEIAANPRSSPAKLRWAERAGDAGGAR